MKKKSLFVFCHFNGLISLIALTSLNYSLLNPSPSSLHQNCQSDLPHLTLIFPPRSSTPSRWHCHFPHLPFLTPISMAPRFPHFHFSFPFRPTSRFLQCSSWSINHPYYPIYKICVLDLNFFNWFFSSFVLQSQRVFADWENICDIKASEWHFRPSVSFNHLRETLNSRTELMPYHVPRQWRW